MSFTYTQGTKKKPSMHHTVLSKLEGWPSVHEFRCSVTTWLIISGTLSFHNFSTVYC